MASGAGVGAVSPALHGPLAGPNTAFQAPGRTLRCHLEKIPPPPAHLVHGTAHVAHQHALLDLHPPLPAHMAGCPLLSHAPSFMRQRGRDQQNMCVQEAECERRDGSSGTCSQGAAQGVASTGVAGRSGIPPEVIQRHPHARPDSKPHLPCSCRAAHRFHILQGSRLKTAVMMQIKPHAAAARGAGACLPRAVLRMDTRRSFAGEGLGILGGRFKVAGDSPVLALMHVAGRGSAGAAARWQAMDWGRPPGCQPLPPAGTRLPPPRPRLVARPRSVTVHAGLFSRVFRIFKSYANALGEAEGELPCTGGCSPVAAHRSA